MPRCCPAEYRRRVIDLIESAVSVAEVADGPGGDGSDDLQLVKPASGRHRAQAWNDVDRGHRVGRSEEEDRRARNRVGCDSARQ